ncbi:MAG: DUF930 domain-containing protein [Rubrivivax sp.]
MSELAPPEPEPQEPPRRDRWIVWTVIGSAILHAGVLVVLLWQPLPASAEATPPPAIDVELVPPPETASASEPPAEAPKEEAPKQEAEAATPPPPAETPPPEPPPEQAADPTPPAAAEPSTAEKPSPPAAPETASEPAAAASEPARSPETSAEAAPIPLSRPVVRGLTAAPASAPAQTLSAATADSGEASDGAAPPAPSAEPDVATLELGASHTAKHFYLKGMLGVPSMAKARAMLETLPPERRLPQTCSIEALGQIGNSGKGFTPDVVMADAYARSVTTGTRLTASGAIFRSGDKWYGLAFDCTLSDDLTKVTAFSYRLGADVTDAVLARLGKT